MAPVLQSLNDQAFQPFMNGTLGMGSSATALTGFPPETGSAQ